MLITCKELFQGSPLWLAAIDETLTCRDAIPAWLECLGLEAGDEVDLPVAQMFTAQSEEAVLDRIGELLRNGGVVRNMPVFLATKNHSSQGLMSAWLIQSGEGPASALIAVMPDAEPDHAGEALTELQIAHQLILDAAGEGVYGLDQQGRATFVNRAATEILGWRAEDVLGQPAHDMHHHSHPDGSPYPRDECPIYAALTDGEVHRVDNEVFWRSDGTAVPVEYTSTPIWRDGKLEGAVVVFRDISKRKQIEQQRQAAFIELSQLQRAHQLILDAAGEGIYGLDCQGRTTFANQAATEILGWRAEDVLGQPAHDVHHHSYPDGTPYPREQCPIYAALKDGEAHHVDNEVFWRTDGRAVPVEYTSTPIRRDGKLDGAVIIFRDISERKTIERQREQAYQEIKFLKEQLELERDYLRDEINITINFGEIVGESQALKRTLAQIEAVAETPVSVLILGESGVGKEMIARAIHTHSRRADKPLVKVNCASIPKDLFESEFFGHVRGAFTGAHRDRIGRIQLAAGGTLFLDEIGEIPLPLQGKLLRALQEQEFERVGEDETIEADIRIVAATNRDLAAEIKAGRFREDLFYRLSVFPIEVPPLRERIDDIAPLAQQFLKGICSELGRNPLILARQQVDTLKRHSWPGNIRELKNVIERAVILSKGERLRLDLALPSEVGAKPALDTIPADESEFLTDAEFREREKLNMIAALRYSNWRIWGPNGAAELLGLKPSTLTYRMKVFGIQKLHRMD